MVNLPFFLKYLVFISKLGSISDLGFDSLPVEDVFSSGGQVMLSVSGTNEAQLLIPIANADAGARLPIAEALEIKQERLKYEEGHKKYFILILQIKQQQL